MKSLLFVLAVLLSFAGVAAAKDNPPVVWVDKAASFEGRVVLAVQPVRDETQQSIPPERLAEIGHKLEEVFDAAGYGVGDEAQTTQSVVLRVDGSVTSYKTGSAAGRWLGFGAGAAKCTLRAKLFEADSGRLVADVVLTRVVDTGGFYSIGADGRIHQDVARELAEAVVQAIRSNGAQP